MTAKPIPIPRDLKHGDIIVLSNGEERKFHCYTTDRADAVIQGSCPGGLTIDTGRGWVAAWERIFAVRIIRKTSKPARVDIGAGAECVKLIKRIARECAHRQDHKARKLPNHLWQEVRAIARRLNRGGE